MEAPARASVRISFSTLVEDSKRNNLPEIHAIFTSPESTSRYPSREHVFFELWLPAEPTVPAVKLMVCFFLLDSSKSPELTGICVNHLVSDRPARSSHGHDESRFILCSLLCLSLAITRMNVIQCAYVQ